METEIVNRVKKSSLEVFDLEDFYPKESIETISFDVFLEDNLILKEKEFRENLSNFSFQKYSDKIILIIPSQNILPSWASVLLASKLFLYAKEVFFGNKHDFLTSYYAKILADLDFSYLQDKAVILKGCSKHSIPEAVFVLAVGYLQKKVRSLQYGEACSSVPIFKK